MRPEYDFFFNFSLLFSILVTIMMKRSLMIIFLALAGCFQTYNEDDDLYMVPVTNNPHIVPNHGSGLPMMGGG